MILLKPDGQLLGRIYVQPREEDLVCPRYPRRRVPQSFSVRVLPYSVQYLSDGPLDTGQIYRVFGRYSSSTSSRSKDLFSIHLPSFLVS